VPQSADLKTAPPEARRRPPLRHDTLAALQRSAGNAAVSRLLARQPLDVLTPPATRPQSNASYIGDDPLAQARSMPPAEPSPVERELLAELRNQTRFRAGLCFTKYVDAAAELKQEHAAADAAPSFLGTLIDLAVGALAPGLAGLVLKPLREELKSMASKVIERVIKDADRQIQNYMAADSLVEKLLSNEARAANVWQGLKAGWANAAAPPGLAVGPMLDLFAEEFSVYLDGLTDHLAGMPAADQVGAYAMFDPHKATKHYYKLEIENLIGQHQELAKRGVVWLEVYGIKRLALVRYESAYYGYAFVRWVPTESWEAARATVHDDEVFAARGEYVLGRHKGDVGGVTAPWAGERYAEIPVHGRPHLAKVKASETREYTFVSWVSPEDELFARSQARLQFEGLSEIKEGALPNLPEPPQ